MFYSMNWYFKRDASFTLVTSLVLGFIESKRVSHWFRLQGTTHSSLYTYFDILWSDFGYFICKRGGGGANPLALTKIGFFLKKRKRCSMFWNGKICKNIWDIFARVFVKNLDISPDIFIKYGNFEVFFL